MNLDLYEHVVVRAVAAGETESLLELGVDALCERFKIKCAPPVFQKEFAKFLATGALFVGYF